MINTEDITEIAKALAKVQAEMGSVKFDSVNPYYRSKYASLGAVIDELKKVLPQHGLSYIQFPVNNEWHIGVETVILHTSGQWISQRYEVPIKDNYQEYQLGYDENIGVEIREPKPKSSNWVQEAGKAITYCRRYALASVFGLYSDEDTDGNDPAQTQAKAIYPSSGSTAPQQVNPSRPYTPQQLKQLLQQEAAKPNTKPATDKQVQLLVNKFASLMFNDNERHLVQEYLLGSARLHKASRKVINVALQWLDLDKQTYQPSGMAIRELSMVREEVHRNAGQEGLLPDPTVDYEEQIAGEMQMETLNG